MTATAAAILAALTLDAVAFRRAAIVVAAVAGFYVAAVVAATVAASAVAATVAVVIVAAVIVATDGASVAPTSPAYLARDPSPVVARAHGPVRRAGSRVTLAVSDVVAAIGAAVGSIGDAVDAAPQAAIRFLEPVWDETDALNQEIDRLADCLARATATRHRKRAADYAERIAALDAIRWGATLH